MSQFDFPTHPLPCAVPAWHGTVTARQWREAAQGVLAQGGRLIALWGGDQRPYSQRFLISAICIRLPHECSARYSTCLA
jgi:hypothetical protein